jgi:hypothetical protein
VEPWEGFNTYARRIGWGNPQPRSLEYHAGRNPYPRYVINYVNPSMMQNKHKLLLLAKDTMVSTKTLASKKNFPGNLVPVKTQAPLFL